MSDRIEFTCNGDPVAVEVAHGETLLSVLRERLGIVSLKDGCAPQGQCGCCTVLVDGDARVACVTPVTRVAGRHVQTVEGLDAPVREGLAASFAATGGSQCGFCTPGIVVRTAALLGKGKTSRTDVDRGLAAHLCRCTGWQTIHEAIDDYATSGGTAVARVASRDLDAAARRAALEGGPAQRVGEEVALGRGGFADDAAPRDALVAVPLPPGSDAEHVEAAGTRWVVAETLLEARARAGKVQGRRTSIEERPPLPLPPLPEGGVRLATGWVEPAYLEPDASWCAPGGEPASALGNGGAFGGKERSPAPVAARELADRSGRAVRVVFSREDTVRLGPKRPPIAASAVLGADGFEIDGVVARGCLAAFTGPIPSAYAPAVRARWSEADVAGPPVGTDLRAVGLAEQAVLLEGALDAAGADRVALVASERAAAVLLDTVTQVASGALAGARVELDAESGALARVAVRVAAGDPLDEVVLRSYAIGAAHMALGWVLTEQLAVDPETGDVLDLTIRSFGIIRPAHVPPIDVTIVDDPGEPLGRASDAVFAAVAGAMWNALTRFGGERPEAFPARDTMAARTLRR